MIILPEDNSLMHYGILRKSGRYPWGSGETPGQRATDFLGLVDDLRKKGMSDTEIARGMGLYTEDGKPWTTSEFRNARTIARNEKRAADISRAERLRNEKGYSNVQIGKIMGINESQVRALLAPGQKERVDVLGATSDMLKDAVSKKGYIDVGAGVALHLGLSDTKLKAAVSRLEKEEGYKTYYVKEPQVATGKMTTMKVLTAPDVKYSEVYRNRDKIRMPMDYWTEDGGKTFLSAKPPLSISSKRVGVRYKEEGGADADGVIYVRPGVDDIHLGNSRYAQVRIAVDGSHYLKGMAMYKDDLPDGVDLVFNTNKSSTGNKLDAMKPLKRDIETGEVDMDNPFGAVIRRQMLTPDGSKPRSVMNIVNEEGDWGKWSKNLSSQMLSKQSPTLAKTQLAMVQERKRREFDEIMNLSNPAVKKRLLESFADDVDAAAVHLKAAALPRQGTHVILPITSMKETEIYAPNFKPGERVVLVRFPHGGTFEIPELKVNNRHPEAKKLLGDARDAVGIHPKVAERLSGADFDGDTVLVIPNNSGKIRSSSPLAGLKGFDPKTRYPPYDGMRTMGGGKWDAKLNKEVYPEGKSPSDRTKGMQMGKVSNLITDMTIRGASSDELARAVRHSMVVIDAEKHALNWKQSAIDNGIPDLMEKYQNKKAGGASTLISRARAPIDVRERKEGFRIDPETGKKIYTETGSNYVHRTVNKRTGEVKEQIVFRTQKSKQLAETDDAHTLSSGKLIEKIYADHSNNLKAMANEARKAQLKVKSAEYSPSARATYAKEVTALNAKLQLALRNAPLERQAQILANALFRQKLAVNPDMSKEERKKIKFLALKTARQRTGAGKHLIEITDAEWDAIQAGAISTHRLNEILRHADLDKVKQLATPKSSLGVSPAMLVRARQMEANGYPQSEIAEQLGVSVSTLQNSLNGGGE